MAYRRKTGPLDAGSKLEAHLASLQAMVVRAMGGKADPQDFILSEHHSEVEQSETGIDMTQVIAAFKAAGEL